MKQKSTSIPQIDSLYWGFMLGGLVRVPLMLSYADLLALPAVDLPCTLSCHGTTHPHEHLWRGVRLPTLLDQLSIQPEAQHAHFWAADGYTTSIPLERLNDAALVYARDDQPLTPEAGFPVRLIVPGLYGYKMPKWIQRVELHEQALAGSGDQNHWSDDGVVQTMSTITQPLNRDKLSGVITLAGTAFAGSRTITRVEVSVDDGAWMPVDFTPQPPQRLVRWTIAWTPPAPGEFYIKVRATDSDGLTQFEESPLIRNGSSAIHSIIVGVTA